MTQILTTGDENAGQEMSLPVPGRASPLRARAVSASSIAAGVPWGSTMFVDPQTTLAPAAQTGAPATPFESAQLAADAGGDLDSIVLGPGDCGSLVLLQKAFTFYGFGLLTLGNLALERVRIASVAYTDPAVSNKQLRFVNIDIVGTTSLNAEGYLAGEGCYFEDAITGALFADFTRCACFSTVGAGQVDALSSTFADAVTADFANFQLCTTGADVTATVACTFRNHTFTAGITVTSPSIELDAYSMATAITAGVTFSTPPRILDAFPAAQFYQTTLGGVTVPTNTDNLMHAIGSNAYGTVAPGPTALPVWTLTPADCVATYSGPGGHRFRVTVIVATRANVAATFAYFAGAVDHQGDVIGDASFANLALGEQQVQDAIGPGTPTQFASFERIVTPANGDTVQPAFGVGAGSEAIDLAITTLTMTIEAVP